MKSLLSRINRNRYFFLFILLFAYAHSIHSRILSRGEFNIYIFTPEAAIFTLIAVSILFLIINFFISYWQKSAIASIREILKIFISSIVMYVLIMLIFGLAIASVFGNIERNFNRHTLILTTFSNLLDGFIYGSFFLAYNYYKRNKRNQEQLATYNKALAENRINQLKTQLNPHFLFNNLNVLDQLIEEDKHKASDFLNQFADIYRFVLQASDKKTISISEELTFAKQYFNLIQHKYGNAYQLIIESENSNYAIVPLTLQLLIENAVQHNLGTEINPVCIEILTDKNLCVSNNLIPKRNTKAVSGRALNNLKEQYKLLTDIPIEIQKSDNKFSVIIPIISKTVSQ